MNDYTHPTLGLLRWDDEFHEYVAEVELAGWHLFSYGGKGDVRQELRFPFDQDVTPEQAAVAEKIVANGIRLVDAVTGALWDEFSGLGPETGHWWHGDLATVALHAEKNGLPPLDSATALRSHMHGAGVDIRAAANGRPAVAELRFEASFEPEHGVGVLTDGERVLGLGYSSDVEPFEPG